jgi:hypothetical protein
MLVKRDNYKKLLDLFNDKAGVGISAKTEISDLKMEGNAMMNNYQTRVYLISKETCWGRFKSNLSRFYNYIVPFQDNMKFIYARYDRNVSGLFETLQFVFMVSMIILLVALYLLISHLASFNYSNRMDETICAPFFPCVLLYSRFNATEKNVYSFTMIFIILLLFITLIRKWSDFKKKDVMQHLFDNDQVAYSKLFFDSWDWKVNNKTSLDDHRHKLKNLFIIGIAERETK